MNTQESIAQKIATVHPSLQRRLSEHVEENDGLIPYVYMGEVVQWATLQIASGPKADVSTLVDLLERLYDEGPDDIRNYIVAGFVEDVLDSRIAALFGPSLSEAYRRVNNPRPNR